MKAVVDVSSASEDFLAPDLRELTARVEALERCGAPFEQSIERRFDCLEATIDRRCDRFEYLLNLSGRLARLETKRESQSSQ